MKYKIKAPQPEDEVPPWAAEVFKQLWHDEWDKLILKPEDLRTVTAIRICAALTARENNVRFLKKIEDALLAGSLVEITK